LRDAKRFVLNYRWIIDTAPLQLYASAIVFAPKQSIIRQIFEHYLPGWISQLPSVDCGWNADLRTLEGPTDPIRSVVFSDDGKLIASGSDDKTVKIWNVATGMNVESFDASRLTNVLSFTDGCFSLGFRDLSTSHLSENEPQLGSTEVRGEVDARLGFGINHDNT
jgi:WD40 repeat protein